MKIYLLKLYKMRKGIFKSEIELFFALVLMLAIGVMVVGWIAYY